MATNPQILLIEERIQNELDLGESHFREFKSALQGPERSRGRQASSPTVLN